MDGLKEHCYWDIALELITILTAGHAVLAFIVTVTVYAIDTVEHLTWTISVPVEGWPTAVLARLPHQPQCMLLSQQPIYWLGLTGGVSDVASYPCMPSTL